MKVVVTCGPAVVAIDSVRRITNFSAGELGVRLANEFHAAGAEVVCLKSTAATTDLRLVAGVREVGFTTNEDVGRELAESGADVILHAAALADFEVGEVRSEAGGEVSVAKLSSRSGGLVLKLRPAAKVIEGLRPSFPDALIVGWKYELDGTREDALGAARRQLTESRTDACVVNGGAFGAGFGLLEGGGTLREFRDKPALAKGLVAWVGERRVD